MSDETWLSAKDAAELFPRIQEDENIDVAACISSITYNNIPKNVVVKNDDEDDEEEDPNQKRQMKMMRKKIRTRKNRKNRKKKTVTNWIC